MMQEVVGALGTLLGAVVGGTAVLVGSSANNRHSLRMEREKRLLSKYEELHQALSRIAAVADTVTVAVLAYVNMGTPYPQTVKDTRAKETLQRASMLIDFYAPDLGEDWRAISVLWDEQGKLVGDSFSHSQHDATWKKQLIAQSFSKSDELRNATLKAQAKLSEVAAPFRKS